MTKKDLHFVNLGENVDLNSILILQKEIVNFLRQVNDINIIYSFTPRPTISLGMDHNHNQLHPNIQYQFTNENPSKQRTEEIEKFLNEKYKNSISIINNSKFRPGGSTYNGPGQRSYFFNLALNNVEKTFVELKNHIDNSMIKTLGQFAHKRSFQYGKQIDIYTQENDEKLKIASQGFRLVSCQNRVEHTQYGVTFHLNKNGITPFESIILPCGIKPEDGRATSLENLVGSEIISNIFDNEFTQQFSKEFNFKIYYESPIIHEVQKRFNEISKDNF